MTSNVFFITAIEDYDTTSMLNCALAGATREELLRWLEELAKDMKNLVKNFDPTSTEELTLDVLTNLEKIHKEIDKEYKMVLDELYNRTFSKYLQK